MRTEYEKGCESNDELRLLIVSKEQHCGRKVMLSLKGESALAEESLHMVI